MQGSAGKIKLNNTSVVSLGYVDADPQIQSEYSSQRLTAKKVETVTALKIEASTSHQKKNEQGHIKAYHNIFNLFNMFANILGIDLDHEWGRFTHVRHLFTMFLIAFVWVCIFYTQVIRIQSGETLRVLEACAIYGVASSSAQKNIGYVNHRHQIVNLFFCIRKICLRTLPGSRADILQSQLNKTLNFLKVFALGVVLCVGFFLACPIKAFVEDRQLMSLLPIEIIFIDQSTTSGFIAANVVMIVLGGFAALGLVIYGAVFIFAIFMYSLKVDLIQQDLQDLDKMWAGESITSLAYKHAYLKNICQKRQDLNSYICEIKDCFETKLFYYFIFNYFSQIICLFEVTKNQWTPGYAIALVMFLEMMFYCYMGTKITIADERFFAAIYATNWYTYDLYSQKLIILLLHHSEAPNKLQLGPIGPLNVITGISVVKSIYSYYTIMTELL